VRKSFIVKAMLSHAKRIAVANKFKNKNLDKDNDLDKVVDLDKNNFKSFADMVEMAMNSNGIGNNIGNGIGNGNGK
jgi:hypothetical protein